MKRNDLIYPKLSYRIVGLLYNVYNELESGLQEKYYQRALKLRFQKENISFEEQLRVPLTSQGKSIGYYYLDFLVDDKVVLELKVGETFKKQNIEQVYAYLKSAKLKLGIIANFTNKGVKFKRIVNLND